MAIETVPMDMQHFLGLVGLTALAVVNAAAAFMRGEILFEFFFGAAAGLAGAHLIRRSLDL
jgi:NhaP-type Na+/H+ or K+/H+ antiporter